MPVSTNARPYRLTSIDMVRGLVIVLMALDHVRDYFHAGAAQDPAADPNVGAALFFTRWITHFCAPAFVFLAGTSVGLMSGRKTPAALRAFLVKRGLWLIAVEWFVIATAFSFAPFGIPEIQGLVFTPMQVLGAIGASMVVLAGAQFMGRAVCLALGVAIVAGHNLLDPFWPMTNAFDTSQPFWVALHAQMAVVVGPFMVIFAYPVLAWIGVMLCGYGTAGVFLREPRERDRRVLRWGVVLTVAFLAVRASHVYGDPNPWIAQSGGVVRTAIDFLNLTKYPPSLLFLLMTLGPMAILCSRADRLRGKAHDVLVTYGRAPFAFYVAHFYLIHSLSVVLGVAQGFAATQFLTYMAFYPKGYGLPLGGVYAVWLGVVVALYPLCRWVADLKSRRTDWWLSYL
jgi:uncharacterized membrane protein